MIKLQRWSTIPCKLLLMMLLMLLLLRSNYNVHSFQSFIFETYHRLGSTLYAMETGEHPAVLRNLVTSPSGTTASALYELENGRIRTVIKGACVLCCVHMHLKALLERLKHSTRSSVVSKNRRHVGMLSSFLGNGKS